MEDAFPAGWLGALDRFASPPLRGHYASQLPHLKEEELHTGWQDVAPTADGGISEGRGCQPARSDLLDEAGVLACQVLAPKLLVTAPCQLPVAPHSGQLELVRLPATPVQHR